MDEAHSSREPIRYSPIGVIRSPFTQRPGMPIQAAFAGGAAGRAELRPEYAEGLKDLEGFSHLILVYHFHQSEGYQLQVRPFLDEAPHGVFATRAPRRPNAIGISTVRLERIEDTTLYVSDLDVLDGTPLLDVKPYVPQFDDRWEVRIGWLEKGMGEAVSRRADDRFL